MRLFEIEDTHSRTMENPLPYISGDDRIFLIVMELADHIGRTNAINKTVPINKIVGTEPLLDPATVLSPRNKDVPLLAEYHGKYYVMDGNHRVANSISNGKTQIPSKVIVIPPDLQMFTVEWQYMDSNKRAHGGSVDYMSATSFDELWPAITKFETTRPDGSYKMVTSVTDTEGNEVYD